MSDTISILGIRARGKHGVLAFEQEIGQPFVVDVEMAVDTGRQPPMTTSRPPWTTGL